MNTRFRRTLSEIDCPRHREKNTGTSLLSQSQFQFGYPVFPLGKNGRRDTEKGFRTRLGRAKALVESWGFGGADIESGATLAQTERTRSIPLLCRPSGVRLVQLSLVVGAGGRTGGRKPGLSLLPIPAPARHENDSLPRSTDFAHRRLATRESTVPRTTVTFITSPATRITCIATHRPTAISWPCQDHQAPAPPYHIIRMGSGPRGARGGIPGRWRKGLCVR